MNETRYKFLRLVDGAIRSENGDCTWTLGEQKSVEGEIETCENGFHCSHRAYDAFTYVHGEILAQVEVSGECDTDTDKEAWQHMTIVRAWKWQKKESVALSIFAAELALANYESLYPDDDRPRKAIEAARQWHESPTEENRSAAESAGSAAESAAWSAAESAARFAARSAAWSAAWSAARFAGSAAESAGSAARSARSAEEEVIVKIADWMEAHIAEMEPFVAKRVSA